MRKSRYIYSQIMAIIKQNEQGKAINELCREHGMSNGDVIDDYIMKRLKELEEKNRRLK